MSFSSGLFTGAASAAGPKAHGKTKASDNIPASPTTRRRCESMREPLNETERKRVKALRRPSCHRKSRRQAELYWRHIEERPTQRRRDAKKNCCLCAFARDRIDGPEGGGREGTGVSRRGAGSQRITFHSGPARLRA